MLEGTLIAGRYRIVRPLGRGGMAQVYEGVDLRLERRVALKRLSDTYAAKPRVRARFLDEGLIQARLSHPNLVNTSDCIDDETGLFIVMEYIEGESLDDYLERSGPLSMSETHSILGPICEALEVVHRAGIVHRDLKPGNLMLDRSEGRVVPRLIDFGVAKIVGGGRRGVTHHGATIGTPHYMAPEQQRGITDLDARADIYALGVIAHLMVVGILPLFDENRSPSREMPPLFDDLIAQSLASDRTQRMANVAIFGEALRRLALLESGHGGTGPHRMVEEPSRSAAPAAGAHSQTSTFDEPSRRPATDGALGSARPIGVGARRVASHGPSAANPSPEVETRAGAQRMNAGLLVLALCALVAVAVVSIVRSPQSAPAERRAAVTGEPIASSAPVMAVDSAEAAGPIEAVGLCRSDAGCRPGQQCVDGWCVAVPPVPSGMVWVPGGTFTMGDGCAENAPAHSVRLSGFAIDRAMREDGRGVTWFEALAACEALGYSLPTEAQWERAAGDGLVELSLGRGDWVVDWYHTDSYRMEAEPDDPIGPGSDECERDPGRWRDSSHWRPDRRCTRVVRGVAHGSCDRVHARSFFGPYATGHDRGYRCVNVPPRSVSR